MRVKRSLALVMTVGMVAPIAAAQDYGDRNDDTAVRDNAVVTAGFVGFSGGDWHVLNSGGHTEVPVSEISDPEFTPIGEIQVETSAETDVVEVAWWEAVLPAGRFIQFVMRTQEGHDFVPFGSKLGGKAIQAYTYEMGGDGNGLDFRQWVDFVLWDELTISYSYDGGQTVFADPTIYDPIGEQNWDGTDDLHLGLVIPGDGVNWIQASYKIEAVPAPSALAVLLAPGVAMLRRRR